MVKVKVKYNTPRMKDVYCNDPTLDDRLDAMGRARKKSGLPHGNRSALIRYYCEKGLAEDQDIL